MKTWIKASIDKSAPCGMYRWSQNPCDGLNMLDSAEEYLQKEEDVRLLVPNEATAKHFH